MKEGPGGRTERQKKEGANTGDLRTSKSRDGNGKGGIKEPF